MFGVVSIEAFKNCRKCVLIVMETVIENVLSKLKKTLKKEKDDNNPQYP